MRRTKQTPTISKIPDRPILFLILFLTGLGLIAIADASAPQALKFFNDELYFFKQQAMWAVLGIIGMTVTSFINYKFWERIATPLFWGNVLLLILVLIPGVGLSALGARRWIVVGPVNFQPSELIKLTMALYMAKVAASGKGMLAYFIPVGIVGALIMLQPDLGTTVVAVGIALVQIFAAGVNLLYFAGAAGGAGILAVILILTSSYRRDRLMAFLHSAQDPLGNTYHIRQVLLALGSGGLFGVGLGHSRQKYLFLPEAATDSIFAVLGEELGFVGAVVLILVFVYLIFRIIRIAEKSPDKFGQIAALGIGAWLGGQVFLNISSMVALTPLTGIPMPFMSYGGTSLVTVLAGTGILLNISRYAKKD